MLRRVNVEPDDIDDLFGKPGALDSLNRRILCGCKPCARQIRCTELTLIPMCLAIVTEVQSYSRPPLNTNQPASKQKSPFVL